MSKYDVIVLGSGPGGYVTAIRASQLGLKTAVIEKESLGGVCLNWGCIPTKALLKSAQVFEYLKHADDYGLTVKEFDKDFDAVVNRSRNVAEGMSKGVQFLMKKNKIDVISGYGTLKTGKKVDVDGTEYTADHIIIATGARSRELPNLPQDGKKVIGYRKAMTLKEQPKKIVIVGSGAIGVEFAYFYNSMGTDVTIVEYMPRIVPVEDEDVSKQLERSFKKSGIKILTSTEVTAVDTSGDGVKAMIKSKKGDEILEADMVLSAVGIKTNIENIGLEDVGIVTDRDKILVNDFYQTNIPGYYAIGDVTNRVQLTPVAIVEATAFVETVYKSNPTIPDHELIATAVFTQPEIGTVGLTEEDAAKQTEIEVYSTKFRPMKVILAGRNEHMLMKLIVSKENRKVLGCHIVGHAAAEMIQLAAVAIKMGASKEDFDRTMAIHPTAAEELVTMNSPIR